MKLVTALCRAAVIAMLWTSMQCATAAAREAFAQYAGILPCADCAALRVDLTLLADAAGSPTTYRQRLTYVDKGGADKVFASAGRWTIVRGTPAEPQATFYRLSGPRPGESQLLRVEGARALRLVDDAGLDIPSPRAQVLWRSEKRFVGAPLAITESDANGAVVVNTGQELVVRLSSNPTTGYRWTLAADADAVLALAATPKYRRDRVAEGMVGSGGAETWRLFAFRPGAQRVSFEYRRPWERETAPA